MTIPLGIPTLAGRPASVAARPNSAEGLIDSWGRVATDLRISLTDRCNLRCT
jgi:cyclic pyranopterin phosphate synthase